MNKIFLFFLKPEQPKVESDINETLLEEDTDLKRKLLSRLEVSVLRNFKKKVY